MAIYKKSKYVGLLAYSKGKTASIRNTYKSNSKEIRLVKRHLRGRVFSFGQLTGFFAVEADGTWFQVANSHMKGWVKSTHITSSKPKANTDLSAQKMINELVQNDILIQKSLTRSLPIIHNLSKKGKLPVKLKNQFKGLLTRVDNREKKLKESSLVKAQSGVSKAYNSLMESWGLSSLKISGVGAIPVIAWVVGVVVVAGLGAGVTAYFLSYHGESKVDLKISDELEKALATLDPKTAAKVKKDLQGQIDNAYSKGYTKGKGSDIFGSLKILGFLLLGAVAADKFIPKRN